MDEDLGVRVGSPERAQHAGRDEATPEHRRRMSARRKQAAVPRLRLATLTMANKLPEAKIERLETARPRSQRRCGDESAGLALPVQVALQRVTALSLSCRPLPEPMTRKASSVDAFN